MHTFISIGPDRFCVFFVIFYILYL
uniref:Uncharacterized protein n=1 Tax=Anguilla anguilla TaxID=7936 RepID=A0A0E9UGJ1_ANGAN